MTIVRAALTQTVNAYADMPAQVDALPGLAGRLDEIRQANLAHHISLIESAAGEGARVIGLGELFSAPYFALERREMWRELAEDAHEGPTVGAMREAAKRYSIVVVAPIYELDQSSGRRFNTAVVIDADGGIRGQYRKLHIPHGSNEQGSFDELFYYEPGDVPQNARSPATLGSNPHFPVFQTQVGRIGVAICYDRHFEGVVCELAKAGAQTIFSPAVTFGAKSRRMWRIEFEVDAARHNVFIGGSNRKGIEQPWGQEYFGESHFVGPQGLAANRSTHPELVIADLDLCELVRPDPAGWDLRRDARPEIFDRRS